MPSRWPAVKIGCRFAKPPSGLLRVWKNDHLGCGWGWREGRGGIFFDLLARVVRRVGTRFALLLAPATCPTARCPDEGRRAEAGPEIQLKTKSRKKYAN